LDSVIPNSWYFWLIQGQNSRRPGNMDPAMGILLFLKIFA
jgi:hypothetical protein